MSRPKNISSAQKKLMGTARVDTTDLPRTVFTELNCSKPAFAHLRGRGKEVVTLNSRAELPFRDWRFNKEPS